MILFANLSSRQRWLLTVCVLLSLVGAWLLYFYLPVQQQIKQTRFEILNHKEHCLFLVDQIEKDLALQKRNERIQEYWQARVVRDSSSVVREVARLAKSVGVTCARLNPQEKTESNKQVFLYEKDGYEVVVHGVYKNMLAFLKKINEIKDKLKIKKLVCRRMSNYVIEVKLVVDVFKKISS